MAADTLKYASGNEASTTLSGGMTNTQTTAPLTSDTNFAAKSGEGMVIIAEGQSDQEWAYATTKSGGALTVPLANRGLEGGSAQAHANGATVKGIITAGMWNDLIDSLTNFLLKTTGAVDTTKIVTPTGSQTLINKTLTAPILTTPTSDTLTAVTTNGDLTLDGNGTGKVRGDALYGTVTTDSDGATITLDCSVTNRHEVILGGNRTIMLTNYATGQLIILDLIQDGTGSRTITWPSFGATATMTIAAPGVVTASKDIPTGTPVVFTTTGALPTGVTASTVYWWTRVSATTGKLSTSLANVQAGTFITTSGSQSGTHTMAVQVRWPSQTAPTLSTGKYVGDTITFYIKSATNTVVYGYTSGQAI